MPALDDRPDTDLAASAARGDRSALEALLYRHADRVHTICRRVLADPDDALDATQEALLAITRGIERFDGRASFTTWLYRVATNAALDEARRRNRRPVPAEVLPEPSDGGPGIAETVADRLDIDSALARIPAEFRAAVALRDLAGFDYAEISETLGIPPGTVRSRIARGRAALAVLIGNREPAGERPNEQRP